MTSATISSQVVLEPAAQAFADATAQPPFVYELPIDAAGDPLHPRRGLGVRRRPHA
jgi:hypothetical protein